MYLTIDPDGMQVAFDGLPATLGDLQELVGGDIEEHTLRRDDETATMIVATDGKRLGYAINPRATLLAHTWKGLRSDDFIVGKVVLVGPADDEGDMTSLSENWQAYIRDMPPMRQSV